MCFLGISEYLLGSVSRLFKIFPVNRVACLQASAMTLVTGLHVFLDFLCNKRTGTVSNLDCFNGSMQAECGLEHLVKNAEFAVYIMLIKHGKLWQFEARSSVKKLGE